MSTDTDRELLEAAARAAGYAVRWHDVWRCFVHEGPNNITSPPSLAGQRHVWVPLTDDGDALRLAVKMGLTVAVNDYGAAVRKAEGSRWHGCEAHLYGGIESATRRAIVRAAAAMAPAVREG